jgi:CHAT domain-containing protein
MLDKSFSQEFTNYLGLPPFPAVKTVEDVQDTLATVEKLTGVRSALVYVNFVPTAIHNNSDDSNDRDQLELVMMTANGVPVRKRLSQTTRKQVLKVAQDLRREVSEPRNVGTTSYLAPAQQLYQWMVQPLAAELASHQTNHISFIMDTGLRTLPVSVLHDGQSFIIERYSVGIIPSLSLTDLRLGNWKRAKIWGLGVSESTQGQIALPSVTTEIKTIIGRLWPGQYHLNQEATLVTLKSARQNHAYGIFHLSTHANFNPGAVQNSFIQLWNERLSLDQFRQLGWGDPPVELLTLSACRTAIGNRESELGYAGLSIQSGVKSVVASLWSVSDAGTSALMTQFYDDLRTAPTKADALRQAQLSMAQGKVTLKEGKVRGLSFTPALPLDPDAATLPDISLSHPYFWSAFTLVGSPW